MSRGLLFWILMCLWAIFGIVTNGGFFVHAYTPVANVLLLFVLFLLLGWQVYGPPLKD